MPKETPVSKTKSAEMNLRLVTYQERVEKYTGKNLSRTVGDIVAFVGPTKAGKSTLINCISGNLLICKSDPALGTYFLEKSPGTNGPEIGGAGESQTSYPEKFEKIPGTLFNMWDFPGFGDNKGTEQEISNAVCYEAVLRPQKSVRFVLVVPKELISSADPMPFYKLLNDLKEICPNISQSLCIVISKFERGSVELILRNIVSYEFPNTNTTNSEVISKGKKIITSILSNKNFIEFRAPQSEDYHFENRDELINMIKNLKGSKISQFPLVIGDQAKKEILELYTAFNHELSKQVVATNKLLKNFFDKDFDRINEISNAESKYEVLKKTQKKIKKIINNSDDFDKFFEIIEKNGFGIENLADCLKKFLFIEKLKNRYSGKEKSSKSDFFESITNTLEGCLKRCEGLIKTVEQSLDEIRELKISEEKAQERYRSASSSSSTPDDQRPNEPVATPVENDSLLVQTAKLAEEVIKVIVQLPGGILGSEGILGSGKPGCWRK